MISVSKFRQPSPTARDCIFHVSMTDVSPSDERNYLIRSHYFTNEDMSKAICSTVILGSYAVKRFIQFLKKQEDYERLECNEHQMNGPGAILLINRFNGTNHTGFKDNWRQMNGVFEIIYDCLKKEFKKAETSKIKNALFKTLYYSLCQSDIENESIKQYLCDFWCRLTQNIYNDSRRGDRLSNYYACTWMGMEILKDEGNIRTVQGKDIFDHCIQITNEKDENKNTDPYSMNRVFQELQCLSKILSKMTIGNYDIRIDLALNDPRGRTDESIQTSTLEDPPKDEIGELIKIPEQKKECTELKDGEVKIITKEQQNIPNDDTDPISNTGSCVHKCDMTPCLEENDHDGRFRLANEYLKSNSEELVLKGFELLDKNAESGHALSQYILSVMYRDGIKTEMSGEKALRYLTMSVKQDYPPALNDMGIRYMQGDGVHKSYESAFTCFKKSTELGEVQAMVNLGMLYKFGLFVKRDLILAQTLFEKAASFGDVTAKYELALLYGGEGEELSFKKSAELYKECVKHGHINSMINLGFMFANGTGVCKSYESAFELFLMAAKLGHPVAQFNVGIMYDSGKGVTRSHRNAMTYYKLAADQGHVDAKKELNKGLRNEFDAL